MALSNKLVQVKQSTLPNAGKGLFAKKFIPKGTRIIEYKGRITTWKEVDGDDGKNGYIYYVKRNYVIDASRNKKALARYANDAKGLFRLKGVKNNADYVEDGFRVFIEAKKDIAAGEEIFVDYGKEYWAVIRHNLRVDRQRERMKNRPRQAA
jgi:SET domain-containing protein